MGRFFNQNRFMSLIRGTFGYWRVEKVVRPMSRLAWAGLSIVFFSFSFVFYVRLVKLRVVLGNEILLSNKNPQCKGSKNLIIDQIYFLSAYFLVRDYVANWMMEMLFENLNY